MHRNFEIWLTEEFGPTEVLWLFDWAIKNTDG